VGKASAQRLPGTIKACFHGFHGALHDTGNFRNGEIFVFGQHQSGALVFRQGLDRGGDFLPGFTMHDGCVSGGNGSQNANCFSGNLIHGVCGVAPDASEMIQCNVPGDLKQLGGKCGACVVGLKGTDVATDADKSFLGNVIRGGRVTGQTINKVQDGVLPAFQQIPESRFVPRLEAVQKFRINLMVSGWHVPMNITQLAKAGAAFDP